MNDSTGVSNESALIIGCGYLGRRLATRWVAAGRTVYALTRSRSAELAAEGIQPLTGDVLDPQSLINLPRVSTVLYAVGLDRAAGKSMRDVYVQGLANVLEHLPRPECSIYVSSTSVYGQTDGDWVDETSVTEPQEGSGLVVREAEELLRSRVPKAIVLRFAGIYGPGRLLREASIRKGEPVPADAAGWLNLIHVDDGVSAVQFVERNAPPGETFNVADNEPVSRRDFYGCLAELLHAPAVTFTSGAPRESNRRVSNRKLRDAGWVPSLKTYREGLAASCNYPASGTA